MRDTTSAEQFLSRRKGIEKVCRTAYARKWLSYHVKYSIGSTPLQVSIHSNHQVQIAVVFGRLKREVEIQAETQVALAAT